MECGKKDLTTGFTVDKVTTSCFATHVDGVVVKGERVVTPNLADPGNPTIEYRLDGVVVPKPDLILDCPDCEHAMSVYVCNQDTGTGYNALTVCDADTGTLWVRWFGATASGPVAVTYWEDTGRACAPPTVVTQDFCIKP